MSIQVWVSPNAGHTYTYLPMDIHIHLFMIIDDDNDFHRAYNC